MVPPKVGRVEWILPQDLQPPQGTELLMTWMQNYPWNYNHQTTHKIEIMNTQGDR
jgi:hypothetical protein